MNYTWKVILNSVYTVIRFLTEYIWKFLKKNPMNIRDPFTEFVNLL